MLGELGGVWLSFALSSIPPLEDVGGADWGGDPDELPDWAANVWTTSSKSTDVEGTAPTMSIGPIRTSYKGYSNEIVKLPILQRWDHFDYNYQQHITSVTTSS